jgi:hypothetical protein
MVVPRAPLALEIDGDDASRRQGTRGRRAGCELPMRDGTMRRIFIGVAGVCLTMGLALQPAQAGERKHGATITFQAQASHAVVVGAPARSSVRADISQTLHHAVASPRGEGQRTEVGGRRTVGVGNAGHGEFSFAPVSPLGTEVGGQRSEVGSGKRGPSTSPRERKSLTLFRLDPKFGDVSVQPVVGGVNGAQVSLGF